MYADDTALFKVIDLTTDIETQVELVNRDLENLGDWCISNKLTINVEKSKVMLFTAPLAKHRNVNPKSLPKLYLNGSSLTFVDTYRYLGLELNNHLRMDHHLQNVIQKVRPIVYKFSKIRYLIDQVNAIKIYKTHGLPVLEFGMFMLDNFYTGPMNKLQKIQNRCLRFCFRKNNMYPAYPLHLKADLLHLHLRRECQLLNLVNKKLIKDDGTFELVVGISGNM